MSAPTPTDDLTRCLLDAAHGVEGAQARLLPLVYESLRRIARRAMSDERPGATLQPTGLVHEAWARLVDGAGAEWNHRGHFFSAAARAMRRILVDRARARHALKRGGPAGAGRNRRGQSSGSETDNLWRWDPDPDWVIDLDRALADLEATHPRQARVVELRYYGGLSVEEVSEAMQVSVGTVERDWRLARARLLRHLSP